MISYQSPGVYIEEVAAGPQPIAAAPTSVVAIVGSTRRGPFREPTRVVGWAEYQAVFGGQVAGGYTAEAMYGFFENGGPAAYVVRADRSVLASWQARAADGTPVFTIEARSPGAWANTVEPLVVPDLTAGSGQLFAAKVAEAADVNLTSAAAVPVALGATGGLAAGDSIRFVTPTGTKDATVTQVQGDTATVTVTGAAFTLTKGLSWAIAVIAGGATAVRPTVGTGFRPGDILLAVTPQLVRRSALVQAVAPASGGALTLGAGFGGEVPAGEVTQRIERLVGDMPGPTDRVTFSQIRWRETPAPRAADIGANHQAVAANGLTAEWKTGGFTFPAPAPAGRIEADVRLVAHLFHEEVTLAGPTLLALAERYAFVPTGTRIRLNRAAGSAVEVTRNTAVADGWDAPGTATTSATWMSVDFLPSTNGDDGLVVSCAREPRVDDLLAFAGGLARVAAVQTAGQGVYVVTTDSSAIGAAETGPFPVHAFQLTQLRPLRFAVTVLDRAGGQVLETYSQLALHPDHPRYYFRDEMINDLSQQIRVTERPAGPVTAAAMPAAAVVVQAGSDRLATDTDLTVAFDDLERVTEPAIVICPDSVTITGTAARAGVVDAMIGHCEDFRRFAVVDAPAGLGSDLALADWRLSFASIQAAAYAPYVRIMNPDQTALQRVISVPPSGFVAGVFALTDRVRGVHKAPANERVRGVVGLDEDYTQRRQDLLNPAGVNLIRAFQGRGIRVWGARTASDDTAWRYVNVRRLFNLIETSVERSTMWVVFEPNTTSTWLRIRVSVENFLDQLWRSGALAGTTAEQAYRVRVGLGETMTETDIDLGLVVTEVAVAPAKPAEFVVFRFSHKRVTE